MTKRADQLLREAAEYLAAADQKQSKADADKWAAAERRRRLTDLTFARQKFLQLELAAA